MHLKPSLPTGQQAGVLIGNSTPPQRCWWAMGRPNALLTQRETQSCHHPQNCLWGGLWVALGALMMAPTVSAPPSQAANKEKDRFGEERGLQSTPSRRAYLPPVRQKTSWHSCSVPKSSLSDTLFHRLNLPPASVRPSTRKETDVLTHQRPGPSPASFVPAICLPVIHARELKT